LGIFDDLNIKVGEADPIDPLKDYDHVIPDEVPWDILQGDALDRMCEFPSNHFDACYCDPPYGLSDPSRMHKYLEAHKRLGKEVFGVDSLKEPDMSFHFVLSIPDSRAVEFNKDSCVVVVGNSLQATLTLTGSLCEAAPVRHAFNKELLKEGKAATTLRIDPQDVPDDMESTMVKWDGETYYLWYRPQVLKSFQDLTPPGGFMGKGWDNNVPSVKLWRELYRVLKPGAPLLAFGGTRMWHRLAVNIEDAGFEMKDTFMWLFSTGFPKALDVSKSLRKNLKDTDEYTEDHVHKLCERWEGYKTSLKPAWEPIVVFTKPLEGSYALNAIQHGVAGFDIESSRIGGSFVSQGGNNFEALRAGEGRLDLPPKHGVPTKKVQSGRFPSNVILDPNAAELLDKQSGVSKSAASKTPKEGYDTDNVTGFLKGQSSADNQYEDSGGASRFYYCAKASTRERDEGLTPVTEGRANPHSTVKPLNLNRYFCKMILPPEQPDQERRLIIPFSGVGSEMIGAALAGWDHIVGMELDPTYIDIAHKRLLWWVYGGGHLDED
jgi:DNA modification methylase